MPTHVLNHGIPPPSPNGKPRQPPPRPNRPPSLRLSSMDPVPLPRPPSRAESIFSRSTATTYENYTFRISQFPNPPTTIPLNTSPLAQAQSPSSYSYQPVSAHSAPSPYTPNFSQHQSRHSVESSQVSYSASQQEEILEDAFIANLLLTGRSAGTVMNRNSGSALQAWFDENLDPAEVPATTPMPPLRRNSHWENDPRMRHVPTSPTLSARTSVTATMYPPPTSAPPPLPALPSPLFNSFFPSSQQPPVPASTAQAGNVSPTSPTSFATGMSSTLRSSGDKTVYEPTAAIPLPSNDVKPVGFARAAYLPKNAAKSPLALAPIQVPKVFSPNLIDLSSPGPSRLSQNTLSPFHPSITLPGLASPTSAVLSPARSRVSAISPRSEAPPNVPEDVESEMEPSTAFYNHAKSQSKSRLSMSSLWSRLSRSTLSSSKHRPSPAWATPEGRKELPPLPKARPNKQELEKLEQEMALPALVNRASMLWQLLDSGRLPRSSMSTHRSVAPATAPLPVRDSWDAYTSSGYVDETALKRKRSQSIRSFFSRTTGRTTTDRHAGHFNVLDEELQRRYMEQIAASVASRSFGQLTNATPENEKVPSPSVTSSFDPYGAGPSGSLPEMTHAQQQQQRRVTILEAPRPVRTPKPDTIWNRFAPGQGRMLLMAFVLSLIVLITVGLGVGLGLRQDAGGTKPTIQTSCSGNLTGVFCDIDTTCVCTGTGTGPCNPLAAGVIAIIDDTNKQFNTSLNKTSVALAYWDMQGTPVGAACSSQASTIDIAPGLTSDIDEKRARWARSALLFNLLRSEDAYAAEELRSFVSTTDFSVLVSAKGKASAAAADQTFYKTVAGFTYDFDKMTVGAPTVRWRDVAKAPESQTSQVTSQMESVLDRFYTSATALSKQTSRKLEHYWEHVLDLPMNQLPKFIAAVRSSPVLFPVDMTASANNITYASILQGSNRVPSFPPPLACSPLMNSARLKNVNDLESQVFGLSSPSSSVPSSFDRSCFGSHPVYGVLDLLRLRTPFFDSRANFAKQAVVLGDQAASRLLVRSGEAFSGYPSASSSQDLPSYALDAGNYGTMDQLQHVLLDFLQAMPTRQASAIAVIIMATASQQIPPTDDLVVTTTGVTVDLKAVPLLEVALFGTLGSADVKSTVSSIATPSGSLFFGSQYANVFRQWASSVATSENPVIWSDEAVSQKVLRSTKNTDATFENVWTQASPVASISGGGSNNDVRNLWRALETAGRLQ